MVPNDLLMNVFMKLDVRMLTEVTPKVNRLFHSLSTKVVEQKYHNNRGNTDHHDNNPHQRSQKQAFQTNKELRDAIWLYCSCRGYYPSEDDGFVVDDWRVPQDDDEYDALAVTYGFPIGQWDVSQI